MNKFARISLFALVALMGCTKVENDFGGTAQKIAFEVGAYVKQTKAYEDGGLLKEMESVSATQKSFRSRAFLHADGSLDQPQAYFGDGVNISWYQSASEWAPDHDYYWPKSPKSYLNFVSWYDFREMEGTLAGQPAIAVNYSYNTESKRGAASLTLGSSTTTRTIAANDDILIADVAWRQNGNTLTYGKDGVSAGVPTLFRHALAQVSFQAKATKLSETDPSTGNKTEWVVRIKGFEVTVDPAGYLALSNTDPGSANTVQWKAADGKSDPSWTPSGTSATLTGSDETLGTDASVLIPFTTVLPQGVDGLKVSFVYEIVTTYKNSSDVQTGTMTERVHLTETDAIDLRSFGLDAWGMNQRITYTISINPEAERMVFDAVLSDWVEHSTTTGVEPDPSE